MLNTEINKVKVKKYNIDADDIMFGFFIVFVTVIFLIVEIVFI